MPKIFKIILKWVFKKETRSNTFPQTSSRQVSKKKINNLQCRWLLHPAVCRLTPDRNPHCSFGSPPRKRPAWTHVPPRNIAHIVPFFAHPHYPRHYPFRFASAAPHPRPDSKPLPCLYRRRTVASVLTRLWLLNNCICFGLVLFSGTETLRSCGAVWEDFCQWQGWGCSGTRTAFWGLLGGQVRRGELSGVPEIVEWINE